MKTKILNKLHTLEKEKNIEILFAIESGSRSWGFPSPDSDYDIRFIYKHPIDHYLSPWDKKDTIEFMTEDDLDGSGWDLKKTILLLHKSNVPLLEHLYSHIFYIKNDAFLDALLPLAETAFSPISVVFHYLSISKKYYTLCLNDYVKLKDLFYCLRTMLACKWVIEKGTFPPVIFHEMLTLIPKDILDIVNNLLRIKSENGEKYFHANDDLLINYIKTELELISSKAKSLPDGKMDKLLAEKTFINIIKSS